MFRVTSKKEGSVEVWDLEGKLAGDWVAELERYWKEHTPQAGTTVQINLKAVTYIDGAGKDLLTAMHRSGMEVKGCGCMMRAVVEEIVRKAAALISPKRVLGVILVAVGVLGII